jgi:hypothetical protein
MACHELSYICFSTGTLATYTSILVKRKRQMIDELSVVFIQVNNDLNVQGPWLVSARDQLSRLVKRIVEQIS